MTHQLNCLLENYKIKLPEQLTTRYAKKRTYKNEIKQNTAALMDFVNINTALLIDLS